MSSFHETEDGSLLFAMIISPEIKVLFSVFLGAYLTLKPQPLIFDLRASPLRLRNRMGQGLLQQPAEVGLRRWLLDGSFFRFPGLSHCRDSQQDL